MEMEDKNLPSIEQEVSFCQIIRAALNLVWMILHLLYPFEPLLTGLLKNTCPINSGLTKPKQLCLVFNHVLKVE
ncbi:hypothetical protein HMI56_005374, partial [Coelomomyces lativittatus]